MSDKVKACLDMKGYPVFLREIDGGIEICPGVKLDRKNAMMLAVRLSQWAGLGAFCNGEVGER